MKPFAALDLMVRGHAAVETVIDLALFFGPGLILVANVWLFRRIAAAGWDWWHGRRNRRAEAIAALADAHARDQLDRHLDQHWQQLTRKETP
ncbi:hypothetical protein ACIQ7D_18055 [Streptomyces sp. NPDC096310]|uniref:hypothetical protein n=1 Tax=Streptomyces sp. NPDC096310 TaxID=3366082 RepID=UPI003825204D